MTLPPRLANKIEVDPSTQCWNWIAATDPLGYGRVRWDGKVRFSHRVVYQMLKAVDIEDLDIDHLCRRPGCCNPDHLEAVPHAENVKRGVTGKLASARYAQHLHCPKGHPLFGPNLYLHRTKRGVNNKQCRLCRNEANRRRRARLRTQTRVD